jgi:hypothetical protein
MSGGGVTDPSLPAYWIEARNWGVSERALLRHQAQGSRLVPETSHRRPSVELWAQRLIGSTWVLEGQRWKTALLERRPLQVVLSRTGREPPVHTSSLLESPLKGTAERGSVTTDRVASFRECALERLDRGLLRRRRLLVSRRGVQRFPGATAIGAGKRPVGSMRSCVARQRV